MKINNYNKTDPFTFLGFVVLCAAIELYLIALWFQGSQISVTALKALAGG